MMSKEFFLYIQETGQIMIVYSLLASEMCFEFEIGEEKQKLGVSFIGLIKLKLTCVMMMGQLWVSGTISFPYNVCTLYIMHDINA